MDTQTITVLMLAGGESSRFWPLREKNLFPFMDKPYLVWHYEQLVRLHISSVVVVTNAANDGAIRAIPVPKDLEVHYVVQVGNGQGQAVLAAESIISNQPLLILNASDYYEDACIASFLETAKKEQHTILLGAVQVHAYFPGGYLKIDENNHVSQIIEKPTPGTEPSDIVRINADYFPDGQALITNIKKFGSDPVAGYELSISHMIEEGVICQAEITALEDWKYLKYPWNVTDVMMKLLQTIGKQYIHPTATIKSNVLIEGAVYIDEGVKIFEGTKIVGPCYIGKHTIIGNNNIIRESHIGNDCVTGFNSDITRSYIGNNSWFHTNYIGDSVIGNNVSMGSGSVCANLRLDDGPIKSIVKEKKIDTGRNKLGAIVGDNVRIGVHVSIMPGVKIGSDSFIAAGIVVYLDIPNSSFVKQAHAELVIEPNMSVAASTRESFRKAI